MNYLAVAVSTAVLVLSLEGLASAQESAAPSAFALPIGQRVRVHSSTEPRRVIGGVSAIDGESLTLIRDDLPALTIPVRSITAVEASRGYKRNWLRGLGLGAAFGLGVGFAFPVDAANCGPETTNMCSRGQALSGSTVLFGGIGAALGALIKTERWTPLDGARQSR